MKQEAKMNIKKKPKPILTKPNQTDTIPNKTKSKLNQCKTKVINTKRMQNFQPHHFSLSSLMCVCV